MPVPVKRDEALGLIADSDLISVVVNREGSHVLFTHRPNLLSVIETSSFEIFLSGIWLDTGHPLKMTLANGECFWLECDMTKAKEWIRHREKRTLI